MKYVYLLLFLPALFSCSTHLDKSITEPLTLEEIKKSMDEDSLFKDNYEMISVVKEKFLNNDLEKAKYIDLTYNRVLNLERFFSDREVRESFGKEWEQKYGSIKLKIDSISNYWEKYRAEKSIEKYVKIELDGIQDNQTGTPYIVNKITPLMGKIDGVVYRFGLSKKEDMLYDYPYYSRVKRPIESALLDSHEVESAHEEELKSISFSEFKNKYKWGFEIVEVHSGGKILTDDNLGIPKSVENQLLERRKRLNNDFYSDEIAKEVLNVEYLNKESFISKRIQESGKEKDPLAFSFKELFVKAILERKE